MRLGGPLFSDYKTTNQWVSAVREMGYSAVFCPVTNQHSDEEIREFRHVAEQEDILIAETGAWSNPISPDETIRSQAIEYCIKQLELADKVGAKCCVNIAGSMGEQWDGPHEDNFSEAVFDRIVDTVRTIIDAVKPDRAHYSLEPMPWVFPDTPEDYLRLVDAIDRKQFAVHIDPVNVINSPRRYYYNSEVLREWFSKLGSRIMSCHAKDIHLSGDLTVHLSEVIPGTGALDYEVYLEELNKLHVDTPLMVEHLKTREEYEKSLKHIREKARGLGLEFK